jgi:Protein of unknown function (DUF1580)
MLNGEKLMPLTDAIERATGQSVHLSTGLRWCTRGLMGFHLESVYCGRRLTSVEAVERFLTAVNERKNSSSRPNAANLANADLAATELAAELA